MSKLTASLVLLLLACKSKGEEEKQAPTVPVEVVRDAGAVDDASATPTAWPELEGLPRAMPLREIVLPVRQGVPRFEVGGPAIDGDIAAVASSQLGFAGVAWRRGALAWTKPAGAHVAPPIVRDGSFVLIGDCVSPPEVPDGSMLLGCLRIVAPTGADQAYMAVHGKAKAVEEFAGSPGAQEVWLDGERVRWRRGDAAVAIDVKSGVAVPAPAVRPVIVTYKDRTWAVTREDDRLVARAGGKVAWQTEHEITALLGTVWLPGQSPMIRIANASARGGAPEVRLLDIDATGSGHGQAAWTAVPGFQLLGQAISPVGDVALAVRLDRNIKRDFIAAFAANALLIWVHPLPEVMRADPVGVAIALDDEQAPEAVVVFHDGDTVTVLPPVSSPPTAPGAARGPSQNPTP